MGIKVKVFQVYKYRGQARMQDLDCDFAYFNLVERNIEWE